MTRSRTRSRMRVTPGVGSQANATINDEPSRGKWRRRRRRWWRWQKRRQGRISRARSSKAILAASATHAVVLVTKVVSSRSAVTGAPLRGTFHPAESFFSPANPSRPPSAAPSSRSNIAAAYPFITAVLSLLCRFPRQRHRPSCFPLASSFFSLSFSLSLSLSLSVPRSRSLSFSLRLSSSVFRDASVPPPPERALPTMRWWYWFKSTFVFS